MELTHNHHFLVTNPKFVGSTGKRWVEQDFATLVEVRDSNSAGIATLRMEGLPSRTRDNAEINVVTITIRRTDLARLRDAINEYLDD